MDEPLGALDKQLREHMQLEIKHLHARLGINVVYVTHDQSEALTMSDRVGVFNDGTLQQVAPPDELYEAPANPFVAHVHRREQCDRRRGASSCRAAAAASAPPTVRSSPALAGDGLEAGRAGRRWSLRPERMHAVAGRRQPATASTPGSRS